MKPINQPSASGHGNGPTPVSTPSAVGSASAAMTPVEEIRRRAREHLSDGPVTADYSLDPKEVVQLLNEALATELVCTLRYKRHYYMAQGIKARFAAEEFLEHAQQEAEHADMLAERIVQLGGEPDFNPETLVQRSHAQYHAGTDLREMLTEDLVAERIAIESYREMVRYLGDRDPTTRRMLEEILAVEEEHADDLNDLLGQDAEGPGQDSSSGAFPHKSRPLNG